MPPVLIACPITDDLIPTGLEVNDLDELANDNLLTACPICGRDQNGWHGGSPPYGPQCAPRLPIGRVATGTFIVADPCTGR